MTDPAMSTASATIPRPTFRRTLAHSALVGGVLSVAVAVAVALSWSAVGGDPLLPIGFALCFAVVSGLIYAVLLWRLPPSSGWGAGWQAVLSGYLGVAGVAAVAGVVTSGSGSGSPGLWMAYGALSLAAFTIIGSPLWCLVLAAAAARRLDPALALRSREPDGRIVLAWPFLTIAGLVVLALLIAVGIVHDRDLLWLGIAPASALVLGAAGWITASRSPKPVDDV